VRPAWNRFTVCRLQHVVQLHCLQCCIAFCNFFSPRGCEPIYRSLISFCGQVKPGCILPSHITRAHSRSYDGKLMSSRSIIHHDRMWTVM
jgi:hypothetical protein